MTPILSTIWTLIAGVMVLTLPGLAWLAFFWDREQDLFERFAEVIGVSISITALLALLVYILGWSISTPVLIMLYLLMVPPALWTLWRWWRDSRPGLDDDGDPDSEHTQTETMFTNGNGWSVHRQKYLRYVILALILFAALIWRFYQIREVALPLWVDSVHHVQIVTLVLDNGGIPESFEPIMPVPFFYHYAFHALAAAFSTIARISPQDAVLYLGQVLNAAIALAVYRLGVALWGGWRRAVLSAILVAFATQMPAYYVTWGRYTLLTGMLLLPLAMATILDINNIGANRSRVMTLAVLTAGILLSHYFAAGLLALFLIVIGVQALISGIRHKEGFGWKTWLPLLLASLAGLILASPWLYRMWGYAESGVKVVAIPPSMEAVDRLYFPEYLDYLWRLVGPDRNHILLFVALPGLMIALYRSRTRVFGVWSLLLGILSLPVGVYVAPFRPDHAAIVLFLPTAMLIAELFISAIDWSPVAQLDAVKTAIVLVIFAALVGWGIWEMRSVINSTTVLATEADLEAIDWINDNLPVEAKFLINVTHWQYGSYRGVDGGWWITPLTKRMASLPNGLYGMGDQEYVDQVNGIAAQVNNIVGCSPEFWDLVGEGGWTYIYLTQSRGSIQPDQFENCPDVEAIFAGDGVFLYRIKAIINPGM